MKNLTTRRDGARIQMVSGAGRARAARREVVPAPRNTRLAIQGGVFLMVLASACERRSTVSERHEPSASPTTAASTTSSPTPPAEAVKLEVVVGARLGRVALGATMKELLAAGVPVRAADIGRRSVYAAPYEIELDAEGDAGKVRRVGVYLQRAGGLVSGAKTAAADASLAEVQALFAGCEKEEQRAGASYVHCVGGQIEIENAGGRLLKVILMAKDAVRPPPAAYVAASTPPALVRGRSLGPIRLGMTQAELDRIGITDGVKTTAGVRFSHGPYGIALENDRVAAVEIVMAGAPCGVRADKQLIPGGVTFEDATRRLGGCSKASPDGEGRKSTCAGQVTLRTAGGNVWIGLAR